MAALKKKSFSLKDKVQILKAVNSSLDQHGLKGRIAKEFGIANSTLSSIIKDKQKIIAAFDQAAFEPERKRTRTAAYKDIEDALLMWFKSVRGRNVPVSGAILQAKATKLADTIIFLAAAGGYSISKLVMAYHKKEFVEKVPQLVRKR